MKSKLLSSTWGLLFQTAGEQHSSQDDQEFLRTVTNIFLRDQKIPKVILNICSTYTLHVTLSHKNSQIITTWVHTPLRVLPIVHLLQKVSGKAVVPCKRQGIYGKYSLINTPKRLRKKAKVSWFSLHYYPYICCIKNFHVTKVT